MVYDKIDNISIYAGLSKDIQNGIEYLRDVDYDIGNGIYEINPRVKAFGRLSENYD